MRTETLWGQKTLSSFFFFPLLPGARALFSSRTNFKSSQITTLRVPRNQTMSSAPAPSVRFLKAWFCPYAQRAWISLLEKNVPFEAVEAMSPKADGSFGYDKIELLLQSNPAGTVPVILTQDSKGKPAVVRESLICIEFVDEAFGEPYQLLPKDPVQRVQARLAADFINNNVCSPFFGVLMRKTPEEREQAKQKLLDGLKKFSSEIQGPFYFGEQFSYVDIAIAPWIYRLGALKRYRDFELPETPEYANLRAWWAKVLARPSLQGSIPKEEEKLIELYGRYAAQGNAQ